MEPRPEMALEKPLRSDDDHDEIVDAIRKRLGSRVRGLVIHRRGAQIELRGRVATYHAKQLAQAAAMEIVGEGLVINLLDVLRRVPHSNPVW